MWQVVAINKQSLSIWNFETRSSRVTRYGIHHAILWSISMLWISLFLLNPVIDRIFLNKHPRSCSQNLLSDYRAKEASRSIILIWSFWQWLFKLPASASECDCMWPIYFSYLNSGADIIRIFYWRQEFNIKYNKQDQQGKAAFNKCNPKTTQPQEHVARSNMQQWRVFMWFFPLIHPLLTRNGDVRV
jgi:hypothetical protein